MAAASVVAMVQPVAACRGSQRLSSVRAFTAAPLQLAAARPAALRPAAQQPAVVVTKAAAAEAAAAAPEAVAHLRYVRGSPLKVRRVLDQIRGRNYEEAIMILEYMPYKACETVLKVLLSAGANAKNNLGLKKKYLVVSEVGSVKDGSAWTVCTGRLKKKYLVVSECTADGGPVLKRAQPRAQGRAYAIKKPLVSITVKLREDEAIKAKDA